MTFEQDILKKHLMRYVTKTQEEQIIAAMVEYTGRIINKEFTKSKSAPYHFTATVETERLYNPDFGDEKICKCGHPYYRHFDTYEKMYDCGCKYCKCSTFKEKR